MKKIILLTLSLILSNSFATKFYWDGGASDNNWESPSNWAIKSGSVFVNPSTFPKTLTTDSVYFDAGTITGVSTVFSNKNCILNAKNQCMYLETDATFSGTISASSTCTYLSIRNNTNIRSGTIDFSGSNAYILLSNNTLLVGSSATINFSNSNSNNIRNITLNGGSINLGSGNFRVVTLLTINSGNFTFTSGQFTIDGSIVANGGTINHNNGTVQLNGSGSISNNSGGLVFYNLLLYNNFTSGNKSYTLSNFDVLNDLTLNIGLGTSTALSHFIGGRVNISGDLIITGTSTSTTTSSTTTTVFNLNGSSSQLISTNASTTSQKKIANITVSNSSGVTLTGNLGISNNLIVNTNSILNLGTDSLNIIKNLQNNGTINGNSSSTIFSGATNTAISGSGTFNFNNLIINKSSTSYSVTLSNNVTVSNKLEIKKGKLNTNSSGNYNISIGGDFTNNDTYIPNTNTTTFNGTSILSGTATHTFYNLSVAGTLTLPSSTTINNNLAINGTLNHNNGTITMSSSSSSSISGSAKPSFYNLTITKSTGSLTISSDTCNIYNSLNINSGTLNTNGKIYLRATSASQYANLIDANTSSPNGSVVGNIRMQMILNARGGTNTNGNPAAYCSPFSNSTVGTFQSNTTNFYFLNASTASFVKASSTSQSLGVGVGFSRRAAKNGENLRIQGAPNNGNISPTLVTSAAGTVNLIGNPYPSTIDWGTVTKNNIGGSGTAYVTTDGSTWTPVTSGFIAPTQGFEVLALTGASIQFTNACRTTSQVSFVRKSLETKLGIKISKNNDIADNAFILFNEDATENFDSKYDFPKLYPLDSSLSSVSFLKSNIATGLYALNDNEFELKKIPLEIKNVDEAKNYKFEFVDLETVPTNIVVSLFDNKENTETKINSNSIIEKTLNLNDSNRFSLVLRNSNYVQTNNENFDVYYSQDYLHILNTNLTIVNNVKIYTLDGTEVYFNDLKVNSKNEINLGNLRNGFYIAKINTNTGDKTIKFVK
ncbi:MAG: T9SS type A sorting domain-containing protein [Cytophagales bacterium]